MLAPDSAVSGFGSNLASATVVASSTTLPTSLGGINVRVLDSSLTPHAAPLYFVSPLQINYVMPTGVRAGLATVFVENSGTILASGVVQIGPVGPALFTASQTGSGLAAARAVIASPNGTIVSQPVADCTSANGRCSPIPILFGSTDTLTLELYGTGIRRRSAVSGVSATANGVSLPVQYAGDQNQYPGLDQVNLQVPTSLANAGAVQIQLVVDGKAANAVSVQFGGGSSGVPVSVLFNPTNPDAGPFPSDALTISDPAQKTGLRINLPLPDCNVERTTCETYRLLNELDGFHVQPRIAVRFSGPVNPNSLRAGIRIVWLENLTNEEKGLQATGHVSGIDRVIFDPSTNTAYSVPDEALDQHRRYALVVTDAVRDALDNPVIASSSYTACVGSPSTPACQQLAQAQGSFGQAGAPAVAASIFTTLSATSWEERARVAVQSVPVNVKRVANINLSGYSVATLKLQTSTNPSGLEDFTVPLPGIIAAGTDRVFFGSYQSPNFLDGRQIIITQPTNNVLAVPASKSELAFHVFLPGGNKPSSGYPVIIFGHGLGDSSFGAPTLVAGAFARNGFATAVINAVGHGSGPQTQLVLTNFLGQSTTIPVPGRGIDLDNDGQIGSREGCLLPTMGIALRDCLRQTTVDLMQLVHAVRDGIDVDGDGTPDLDRNKIYYAGQSLGSLYGTLFSAVEPDVRASALNVGGGSVVDIAVVGDQFRSLARDILAMHTPSILNAGNDFNANVVLRGQPARVNTVPGAIPVQNYLALVEWLQAVGDPIPFAPHLKLSPLAGVPAKRLLFQIARGDRTVPNPTNANLIRQAGGQDSTVLYRHDVARANSIGLPDNPHAFLVDFRSVPGLAIAQAAQNQIAGFATADGSSIPDANSTAIQVLFFGNRIFERPAAPPEDLGYVPGP